MYRVHDPENTAAVGNWNENSFQLLNPTAQSFAVYFGRAIEHYRTYHPGCVYPTHIFDDNTNNFFKQLSDATNQNIKFPYLTNDKIIKQLKKEP